MLLDEADGTCGLVSSCALTPLWTSVACAGAVNVRSKMTTMSPTSLMPGEAMLGKPVIGA